jgi:hypothetical protein
MKNMEWRIRILVLWLIIAVFMSAHGILLFSEPGIIEQTISEEIYQGMDPAQMLFAMSLFWLIPLWMAFLSVTLRTTINRWTNIILGVVFTIFNIWHITEPCCVMVHQKLIVISTIVASLLIVWYAWKWPKQEPLKK